MLGVGGHDSVYICICTCVCMCFYLCLHVYLCVVFVRLWLSVFVVHVCVLSKNLLILNIYFPTSTFLIKLNCTSRVL